MWDAARLYSQTAYPEKMFPVTENARCLLCQQELQTDVQHRLKDFETFVGSKLEGEANLAEQAHANALADLPLPPTEEQLTTLCAAAALDEFEWPEGMAAFWGPARLTRAVLMATEVNEFDRAKGTREKLALEAQRWISQQKAAVFKEVERLKGWQDFETRKVLANSRKVSLKASEVAENVTTESSKHWAPSECVLRQSRPASSAARRCTNSSSQGPRAGKTTRVLFSAKVNAESSRWPPSWPTSPASLAALPK